MVTRAKEISESYKGSEITFERTASAVAKGFVSTDVQNAIVEAKYVAPIASQTVLGLARQATDYESLWQVAVNAYVTPAQMGVKINNFWQTVIRPAIPVVPPPVVLPTITYGGSGSLAGMAATYNYLPVGSFVVFEEYYTYEQGWGNGSSIVGAYRRRTCCKTNNAGWQMLVVV